MAEILTLALIMTTTEPSLCSCGAIKTATAASCRPCYEADRRARLEAMRGAQPTAGLQKRGLCLTVILLPFTVISYCIRAPVFIMKKAVLLFFVAAFLCLLCLGAFAKYPTEAAVAVSAIKASFEEGGFAWETASAVSEMGGSVLDLLFAGWHVLCKSLLTLVNCFKAVANFVTMSTNLAWCVTTTLGDDEQIACEELVNTGAKHFLSLISE